MSARHGLQAGTVATLDTRTAVVLAEYESRQVQEEARLASLSQAEVIRRRDEFLLPVGRATGVLVNLLAREAGAHSILELGTAYGYSTIWLADAARATGGRVVTVEIAEAKQQDAKAALERAGLSDYVEFRSVDALAHLASTPDLYDFVLLDLWKDIYIPCVDALLGRLVPGATIIADNMLEPADVRWMGVRYQRHVQRIADLQTIVLAVGSGLAISRYQFHLPRRTSTPLVR